MLNEGKTRSVQSIANEIQKIAGEMKKLAKDFSTAKSKDNAKKASKILNDLKSLTADKKELEREMDKAVQELDSDAELTENVDYSPVDIINESVNDLLLEEMEKHSSGYLLNKFKDISANIIEALEDEGYDYEQILEFLTVQIDNTDV